MPRKTQIRLAVYYLIALPMLVLLAVWWHQWLAVYPLIGFMGWLVARYLPAKIPSSRPPTLPPNRPLLPRPP